MNSDVEILNTTCPNGETIIGSDDISIINNNTVTNVVIFLNLVSKENKNTNNDIEVINVTSPNGNTIIITDDNTVVNGNLTGRSISKLITSVNENVHSVDASFPNGYTIVLDEELTFKDSSPVVDGTTLITNASSPNRGTNFRRDDFTAVNGKVALKYVITPDPNVNVENNQWTHPTEYDQIVDLTEIQTNMVVYMHNTFKCNYNGSSGNMESNEMLYLMKRLYTITEGSVYFSHTVSDADNTMLF